jgi:hypothetical protein
MGNYIILYIEPNIFLFLNEKYRADFLKNLTHIERKSKPILASSFAYLVFNVRFQVLLDCG